MSLSNTLLYTRLNLVRLSIPREEVEEINNIVMREMAVIQEGCKSMVVGGSVLRSVSGISQSNHLASVSLSTATGEESPTATTWIF